MSSAFRTITLKGLSLFLYLNVVRVFVVLIALYFSGLFIFNTEESSPFILGDWKFHAIIFASLLSIAAGYIIHYFYEEELLRIQKPFQSYFKQFLSKTEYLSLYLIFNTISLVLAGFVSWKMLVFFLVYQFLIWLYSHKLKSKIWIGNLSKTLLTLLPFVALMYHFQNFSFKVISFGVLLFILIILKEILKDFNTEKTDVLFDHQSLPLEYGRKNVLPILLALLSLAILLNVWLPTYYNLGILELYLYFSALIYFLLIVLLLSKMKKKYFWSLWILKIWIFVGVVSIPFINWNIQEVIQKI